ncbi:hypothetical protein G6F56_012519 [Rhizopus delemar]|nr:hypothetical protein G6F56_012519 [Rhizopus delemar]
MDDYDSARLFLAKWAAGLAEESERNSYKKQIGVWGHEESSCGLFEILNASDDTFAHTRTLAVDLKEWSNWFDDQGRLKVEISLVRQRIFSGGVRPEIRKEAWLFLTSVYPWKSTALERQDLDKKRKIEYEALKKQW